MLEYVLHLAIDCVVIIFLVLGSIWFGHWKKRRHAQKFWGVKDFPLSFSSTLLLYAYMCHHTHVHHYGEVGIIVSGQLTGADSLPLCGFWDSILGRTHLYSGNPVLVLLVCFWKCSWIIRFRYQNKLIQQWGFIWSEYYLNWFFMYRLFKISSMYLPK